jgi:hypothetical protein
MTVIMSPYSSHSIIAIGPRATDAGAVLSYTHELDQDAPMVIPSPALQLQSTPGTWRLTQIQPAFYPELDT